ncbi:lysophospholipid acyltransferase family protein [bacterium]|nr:lysophospholipid acyltransferase family protein [bacterium]
MKNNTIFFTPILRNIMPLISNLILFCLGWRVKGKMPDAPKCVIIAAPHTSNWDFVYMLLTAFVLKTPIYVMGKKSLTEGFFGGVMLWLGIIPIDRSKSNNIVELTIEQFNSSEKLIIIVPPSGTRDKITYWKTGFYYIALGAKVPISLGFIDYGRKIGGIGPLLYPTGNIDADMKLIKQFYSDIKGKNRHS